MFVDGKSIKWELDGGRRVTADELLRAAVRAEATDWGSREFGGFTTEELEELIWTGDLPTPEEIDVDSDIPALVCSAIRRGLPLSACYYCGVNRRVATMHTDHMRPRSRGGGDASSNCVQACKTCNLRKSADVVGIFRDRMAERYGAESSPTFFGELPKVRRVLGIETQTAKARHPKLKPAETRPLSRMGEPQTGTTDE